MQAPSFNFNIKLGRRGGANIVGLDIQPGHVAAVQAHVNGAITVKHAAGAPLPADIVREGEVLDEGVLAETLRELFKDGDLDRRVRLGVANQRTVLRTLDLPPVDDRKEIEAAVRFQAQDQVPMPLSNAVLDFHALGIVETPEGPRQRVVLVAAQRDMIQRLLAAVRDAGLRPEGIDLSAFALIRSLYRPDPEHAGRVLYLNVDGLTNMAIAEGTLCRFTRVVGGGIEAMASQLAERRSIPLVEARALIAAVDLTLQPAPEPAAQLAVAEAEAELEPEPEDARSIPRRRRRSSRRPSPPRSGRERRGAGRARARHELRRDGGRRTDAGRGARVAMSHRRQTFRRRSHPCAPPRRPTPTCARCSRTASAKSPARCATRSTSTAPRRAGARSRASC